MSYRYSKTKIDGFIQKIRYNECVITSAKSSWPGGQHINKRETKVQLSWNRKESTLLPGQYHSKFWELNQHLITQDGILRLDAQVNRTQDANKEIVKKKLSTLIYNTFKPAKAPRKFTTPPKQAIDARIAAKKRRSKIRKSRTVITAI